MVWPLDLPFCLQKVKEKEEKIKKKGEEKKSRERKREEKKGRLQNYKEG